MDLPGRIEQHFQDAAEAHRDGGELLAGALSAAAGMMVETLLGNGRILVCGSGSAAALAQHFVALLVSGFERERPELAAAVLVGDAVGLTAGAARDGWSGVFARGLRALGQPGDTLVILAAQEDVSLAETVVAAHQRDMRVIALTGSPDGRVASRLAEHDVHVCLPELRPARLLETQLTAIHALCDGIDCLLMGEEE